MPPKKRNYKKKKAPTEKKMESVARKVLYKQIPRKLKTFDGENADVITNSSPWTIIKPLLIDFGTSDNYMRQSDHIFAERCSGWFNFSINTACTNRVEVRELVGFYKGSTDFTRKSQQQWGSSEVNADLPNKMSRWDRDNYRIVHDKVYDYMPLQIYNAGTGGGANVPNGIWKSKMIKLNLPMYRKYSYSNTVEGGSGDQVEGTPASSNYVLGWQPFIALQIRCPDQDFTGPDTGSNPSPEIDFKFTTYFKDIH